MLNSCIGVSDYNEPYSLCQPLFPSPVFTLGSPRSTQRQTTPLQLSSNTEDTGRVRSVPHTSPPTPPRSFTTSDLVTNPPPINYQPWPATHASPPPSTTSTRPVCPASSAACPRLPPSRTSRLAALWATGWLSPIQYYEVDDQADFNLCINGDHGVVRNAFSRNPSSTSGFHDTLCKDANVNASGANAYGVRRVRGEFPLS